MSIKTYELIKKYFDVETDEDLFKYDNYPKHKESHYSVSNITDETPNVINAIKDFESAQQFLDSSEGNLDVINDAHSKIDDGIRELSNVNDSILDVAKAYENNQDWANEWKDTAIEMLLYMIKHHPDEIDDTGVTISGINNNLIKSLEGSSKYNL